jgi:hypothetical protein
LQPSVKRRPLKMSPAALTMMPEPYSTSRFAGVPDNAAMPLPEKGANALDITTTSGSMMPSVAWS